MAKGYNLEQTGPQVQEAINKSLNLTTATQSKEGLMSAQDKQKLDSLDSELAGKVDKVPGKGLSTNDYDNSEKSKVASAYQKPNTGIPNEDLSDGVKASLGNADSASQEVADIKTKIPSQATAQNQLADRDFVNSSIATATADFKGTYDSLSELQAVTADKNDYGYVVSTDQAGNTVYGRYKYDGSAWVFEYDLNNSSFTAAEWASIQSQITSALVQKLSALPTNQELSQSLSGKQDIIPDLSTIRSGANAGATAYQKPSSGIPASDLAEGVIPEAQTDLVKYSTQSLTDAQKMQARTNIGAASEEELDAISRGEYVETWDGVSEPVVAGIPSGVQVEYNSQTYTGTLAASNDTLGKIYLVATGTSNEYNRYRTSRSGVEGSYTYSWVPFGSTQMNLSGFATKNEVSQLQQEVTADISQLEAEVSQLDEIVDVTRRQRSNLLDISAVTDGYYWWIYGAQASATLFYSAHIPVTPGEVYTLQRTVQGGREIHVIRMIVGYKADGTRATNGAFENVLSYTAPQDCAYVIITSDIANETRSLAFVKSSVVIPYEPFGEDVDVALKTGIVKEDNIENDAVTEDKISNNAVTIPKLAITTEVKSKNLLNPSLLVTSKWIGATGYVENVVSTFGYYGYIEVDAETNYHISNSTGGALCERTDAYIAFYDENKTFISAVNSKQTDITTPAGCAFVRISVNVSMTTDAQMEKGTTRTSYEAYFAPYLVIDPQYISFPDDGVTTPKIANGAVTRSKIADGVSLPASPRQFGSIRLPEETLAPTEIIRTDRPYYVSKNIAFVALIKGAVESVEVGTGHNAVSGEWVEVTPTQIKTKYGSSGTVNQTFNHGLTLGSRTKVIIEKNVTKDSQAEATIRLIDDFGNYFQQVVTWWGSVMGSPFVYNNNSSGNVEATLSVMFRDITKAIWMFGDSYFNYDGSTRWPYFPIKWGFDNFLLNGRGGENATEAYADFQNLLAFGEVPAYCVWCLGMNSGRDTDGAVNPTWLSTTRQFISDCEGLGIEPILATIPSVPTEIHTKLNEWVRASGYRYIDFAEAVEQPGTNTWRGWGTENALLSNDEVHPSSKGAVELATKALQDFPEMMVVRP